MADYHKPLPVVNDLNRPHWEAARDRRFLVQRCRDCGKLWFPPQPNCSNCLSVRTEWTEVSGRGTIFSFVIYHQAWLPGFREELPYNVAIVELEEGIRLINNIVGISNEEIRIGMPVEVTYEDVAPEVTIPKFRPVGR